MVLSPQQFTLFSTVQKKFDQGWRDVKYLGPHEHNPIDWAFWMNQSNPGSEYRVRRED